MILKVSGQIEVEPHCLTAVARMNEGDVLATVWVLPVWAEERTGPGHSGGKSPSGVEGNRILSWALNQVRLRAGQPLTSSPEQSRYLDIQN